MDFYQKYLQLCNEKNLSPSSVALSAGVSRAAASRWKTGSIPSDATIMKLSDCLGVEFNVLKDSTLKHSSDQPDNGIEKSPAETAEPKKEDNSLSIEFLQKMAQLTPEQRKLVESYMSFLLSTQG